MECIIFIGLQACGKSSFYRERFFRSHMRINLDMLRTRHREQVFLQSCLETGLPCVIDNTNPRRSDRQRYLPAAREAGFRTCAYYFQSQLQPALERNSQRSADERIPDAGLRACHAQLELPDYNEGFDQLYYVEMAEHGNFEVKEWQHEV